MAVKCPKCFGETRVTDTRHNTPSNKTHRLRKCDICKNKFKTIEYVVEYLPRTHINGEKI